MWASKLPPSRLAACLALQPFLPQHSTPQQPSASASSRWQVQPQQLGQHRPARREGGEVRPRRPGAGAARGNLDLQDPPLLSSSAPSTSSRSAGSSRHHRRHRRQYQLCWTLDPLLRRLMLQSRHRVQMLLLVVGRLQNRQLHRRPVPSSTCRNNNSSNSTCHPHPSSSMPCKLCL